MKGWRDGGRRFGGMEPGRVVRPDDAEDVMSSLDRGKVKRSWWCGLKQMGIEKLQSSPFDKNSSIDSKADSRRNTPSEIALDRQSGKKRKQGLERWERWLTETDTSPPRRRSLAIRTSICNKCDNPAWSTIWIMISSVGHNSFILLFFFFGEREMEETAISNHIASFRKIRSKIEREVTQERGGGKRTGNKDKDRERTVPRQPQDLF
jgi:hypothetical protein